MLARVKYFRSDVFADAATEFALIMPLLIFFMVVEFDVYRYVMATQRLEIVAESVSQMLASTTASPSAVTAGNGVVGDWDINFYMNSSFFVYPDLLTSPAMQQGQSWWQALDISTTAIKMVPISGGGFKAVTVWHGTNQNNAFTRQCNATYSINADTSVPSPSALPSGVVGPNSLIVVDVRTTFVPTFGASYISPILIVRSVYATPRNVPFVEYSGSGWMATNC